MKWKLILFGALIVSFSTLKAQVTLIGHISAEVIESAAAGFEGETALISDANATINLGAITFQSDPTYQCSCQISSVQFSDENDNISATAANETLAIMNMNDNGKHDLNLTTHTPDLLNGKIYNCNYQVVFAYY